MKTQTIDPRITQAAQALSQAFIQFSIALRDSDIAVTNPSKNTVTKATFKEPRAKRVVRGSAKRVVKVTGKRASTKSLAGSKAQMKPCPVTGILNTHRRFSYLMPEVRTATNLKRFKGWANKQPLALSAAATEQVPQAVAP